MKDRILIVGKGVLGAHISSALEGTKCCVNIASLREGRFTYKPNIFNIIIDCMDPSHCKYDDIERLHEQRRKIRESIVLDTNIKIYAYISSANVYAESSEVIDEFSALMQGSCCKPSRYVANKLKTESFLLEKMGTSLCILRPVCLWTADFDRTHDTFFSNLIDSRYKDYVLPKRKNDDQVITYMHYADAAKLIVEVLIHLPDPSINIVNITSGCWSSRVQLKSGNENDDITKNVTGRRVISKIIHSQQSNLISLP